MNMSFGLWKTGSTFENISLKESNKRLFLLDLLMSIGKESLTLVFVKTQRVQILWRISYTVKDVVAQYPGSMI